MNLIPSKPKSKILSLVGAALLLSACNTGGTIQPSPQPQPTLVYPYNPPANAATSSDPRVPYYGDWVWVVGFADKTTYVGKMSLNAKGDADSGLVNAANGAASRCSSSLSTCVNTSNGQGVMGTVVFKSGAVNLASAFRTGTGSNQTGFLALDQDGQISFDTELKQPIFEGPGLWFSSSSSSDSVDIYILIAQQDADPEIKAQTANFALPALDLPSLKSFASLTVSPARQAALERMKSILEHR